MDNPEEMAKVTTSWLERCSSPSNERHPLRVVYVVRVGRSQWYLLCAAQTLLLLVLVGRVDHCSGRVNCSWSRI